jgi:hypothetical protein
MLGLSGKEERRARGEAFNVRLYIVTVTSHDESPHNLFVFCT